MHNATKTVETGPISGTPASSELVEVNTQLERLWSRHAAVNAALDDVSPLDSGARVLLGVLERAEPARSIDLAPLLGLSRPAVSRRLSALHERGLIEGEVNEADQRETLLRLSERGRAHRRAAVEASIGVTTTLTRGFSADELRALSGLLERLIDNAAALDDAAGGAARVR